MKKILFVFLLPLFTVPAMTHDVLRDASTLTRGTIPDARLDPSSVTLQGNAFNISTLVSSVAAMGTSTMTLYNQLTSTSVEVSNNLALLKSTATQVSNYITANNASTTTLRTDIDGKTNAGQDNAHVITSSMTLGFGIQTFRDEGTALTGGNVTSVDCVGKGVDCTQSGSSVTVTITASITKTYELVVGTPGAIGVDAYVSSLETWNSILSSVGARGLIFQTTVYASIFMKNGVYQIQGATIPQNVTVICGSSVVWKATNGAQGIARIYGKVNGMKFDLGGIAFKSRMVWVSSFARLSNWEIMGSEGMIGGAPALRAALFIDGVDIIIEDGVNRYLRAIYGLAYYGDLGNTFIYKSTGVIYRRNYHYGVTPQDTQSTNFGFWGSTHIDFIDNVFEDVNQNGFAFNSGNAGINFSRNRITIKNSNGAPDHGLFVFSVSGNNGIICSTPTVFNNNEVIVNAGAATNIFYSGALIASEQVRGLVIRNNVVRTLTANGFTFATLNTGNQNTILQGNHTFGNGVATTFISDSGVGTKYTGLGNFKDHVEQ